VTSQIFTYFYKIVAMKSVYFIFFMCVCVYNIYIYIYGCWLYISIIPKIVKIFKIELNSYLLEYLVMWCILGEREFS